MTPGRRSVPEGLVHASHTIPAEVARRLRLAVFDVDGVLTDAGVYLGESSSGDTVELKRIQGKDLYTGIYDMTEGMRMEVVLYPGSGYVLAVAFGTLRGEFGASASARSDLFENRVGLP